MWVVPTIAVGLPILRVLHHVPPSLVEAEIIRRQHHLYFVLMGFLWVGFVHSHLIEGELRERVDRVN